MSHQPIGWFYLRFDLDWWRIGSPTLQIMLSHSHDGKIPFVLQTVERATPFLTPMNSSLKFDPRSKDELLPSILHNLQAVRNRTTTNKNGSSGRL